MFKPATLIILALVALAGAAFGVRQYAPEYLPDRFTTDAVLHERMRERIADDPEAHAFFEKFEVLFPADYNQMMSQLVVMQRRGDSQRQVLVFGQAYMRSFMSDNMRHIATADADALRAMGASLAEGIQFLRRENPGACALYIRAGAAPPSELSRLSPEARAAFIRITNAALEGIASGKRNPIQYEQPTEAQWLAWLNRYMALGGNTTILEALDNDAQLRALDPSTICEASDLMWQAVLQAEDDFTPRFVSYSMQMQ